VERNLGQFCGGFLAQGLPHARQVLLLFFKASVGGRQQSSKQGTRVVIYCVHICKLTLQRCVYCCLEVKVQSHAGKVDTWVWPSWFPGAIVLLGKKGVRLEQGRGGDQQELSPG
jgi:hypothetical protein